MTPVRLIEPSTPPVPAPWKPRTLAGLIDLGIVAVYVVFITLIIGLVFSLVIGAPPLWAAILLGLLFVEAPVAVWWWRQESLAATTIGKRRQGLRLVRMNSDRPPSSPRCAVRQVMKILPWALVHLLILVAADLDLMDQWWWSVPALAIVAAIGAISILVSYFRIDHRTGYDLVAGTQVVLARGAEHLPTNPRLAERPPVRPRRADRLKRGQG